KIVYANITTEDGRTLQIREGQKGDAEELLDNLTRANKGEEQVFKTKEDLKQAEKSVAPEVVSDGSATPTTVEAEKTDIENKPTISKEQTEATSKEVESVSSNSNEGVNPAL